MFDFFGGPRQQMWIMYFVWPITGMYFGPVAAWFDDPFRQHAIRTQA
jgi:hypothetical protein